MIDQPQHHSKTGRRNGLWPALHIAELARRCGLSEQYVGQVMLGKKRGSLETVRRLSRELGMTIEELADKLEEVRSGRVAGTDGAKLGI